MRHYISTFLASLVIVFFAAIGAGRAAASDIIHVLNCSTNEIRVCTYNQNDGIRAVDYNTEKISTGKKAGLTCTSTSNPPKCWVKFIDFATGCDSKGVQEKLVAGYHVWFNQRPHGPYDTYPADCATWEDTH